MGKHGESIDWSMNSLSCSKNEGKGLSIGERNVEE